LWREWTEENIVVREDWGNYCGGKGLRRILWRKGTEEEY